MFKRMVVAGAILASVAGLAVPAQAQDVTLRVHHMLSPMAPVPKLFITPWAEKVEKDSGGRIKVEVFPAMQLGGKPPSLYDQAREGIVDVIWTLTGYTPGRFPGTEAFELPFMPVSAEKTSMAAWDFYEKNLQSEFASVKVLATFVHGPGLLHTQDPIAKLEDVKGMKLRGPTRMVNKLLSKLGAIPVGMPVPAVPEALSKGVISGTVIPWEVVVPLKVAELVKNHTSFSGDRGLYTAFMVFAMNEAKYNSLPDDLKKVIDDNSGLEASRLAGKALDEGDKLGPVVAAKQGNNIVVLDDAETQRWKDASADIESEWIAEVKARGIDGAAFVQDAKDLIAKYAAQ